MHGECLIVVEELFRNGQHREINLLYARDVAVYFPNCNRHTADKYIFTIFRGVQFVVIPSVSYLVVTYD